MDVKELNNRILGLEKKYSTKQDQVSNYYKELLNTFYEYADSNYNTDYEFDEVFKDIVCGEDCIGLVMGAKSNELYFWKDDNGCTRVDEIDYKYLADLSRQALKCYDKEKKVDFDIC
ncbi:MAG: hypothetical protein ACI310_00535 [Bacilli bacterium]